jgi:glucosylglycerate phosphorylase
MMNSLFTFLLVRMYGSDLAAQIEPRILSLVDYYRRRIPVPDAAPLSERDSILITYGDQLGEAGQPHLRTLVEFCEAHLRDVVGTIHILPFFPWSSDDGFSVKDYREVDPALGNWSDVDRLQHSFRLMFDGVINHTSAQGAWFKAFLRNEAPYRDYFLTVEGNPDLSQVVRPRALPLLTEFQTTAGSRRVWTTFSADQVDLDFHNPHVLVEIIDILLLYVEHGAQFIRLDAIAYLWKEIGTTCLHLPQTHAFIQLLRAVLDEVAPHVYLVTETNVPHKDNISYFGDGTNEAQLVYNFALPPLVLHTFHSGDASILSEWASGLDLPSNQSTFFNFLASHDGIGLNPVRGILSPAEIESLVERTRAHGGLISFKQNSDGTQSPYEMNINYFDALSDPAGNEQLELQVNRFLTAQAIMLSLRGVPGIYFHSLFGSRGWTEGVNLTHQNRTINRQKLERSNLESELADPNSLRSQVFERFRQLLFHRAASPAFHPQGGQKVLDEGPQVFAVLRSSPNGDNHVLCLHNVTAQIQTTAAYKLDPYQTLWIDIP